jgi:hypothetical protein
MRKNLLNVAIASAFAAFSIASYAQTSGQKDSTGNQSAAPNPAAPAGSLENRYGRSPRCDSMSGADKEQCLQDEASKTQGSAPDDKSASGSASSGSSAPSQPDTENTPIVTPSSRTDSPSSEKQ